MHLSIDIETYSTVNIMKSGLYKYVQSPDFQILLFAYSFDYGPVYILDLTKREDLNYFNNYIIKYLLDPQIIKHAYNAAFEWYCLSKALSLTDPLRWLPQWRCTMVHGLYCGYTAGLGVTAEAMGFPEDKRKSMQGKALIKVFCTPCTPTPKNGYRTRTLPHHEPEKWALFKEYCRQDVVVEMEIAKKLQNFPVPGAEQTLWEIDQIIAARGVRADMRVVSNAIEISETTHNALLQEATAISGLDNPKSTKQLKEWLEEELDEELTDLRKDTVKELIPTVTNESAKRMLEIRQEISKTSVKKYSAIVESVCNDNRVRGILQFYGANRTGRWAGRLVQLHNLPQNHIETLAHARECVKLHKLNVIKLIYGNIPDMLSQLIRTAFIPSEGKAFIVADFSAIEARVIAWLAGETWRQEVFATHGKIYEASASAMFGVPIEKIKKGNPEYELRQKGKIAELALGYQGNAGALIQMGALEKGLTEDELPDIVSRWRASNKRIVELWYAVDRHAVETVKTGRSTGTHGIFFNREFDPVNNQDFLTITLPSGRKLYYVKPFIKPNQWGNDSIGFYSMGQQNGKNKSKKWAVTDTYGGKLVENIVQAIARDCLAESIKRLHFIGYEIVFHVHDEVIIEGRPEDLDTVCKVMGQPVSWAPGLLLKAEGFSSSFYKKE